MDSPIIIEFSKRRLFDLAQRIDHVKQDEKPFSGDDKVSSKETDNDIESDDLLPFAALADSIDLNSYPVIGMGFGISSYNPDLAQLNSLFKYMSKPYFRTNPIIWTSVTVRFSYALSLLAEAGNRPAEAINFKSSTVSLVYHFPFFRRARFRPYVGAGIGKYKFSISKCHGDCDDGSYGARTMVIVKGTNTGYNFSAGIESGSLENFVVCFYGNYWLIPELSTIADYNTFYSRNKLKLDVNLSSIVCGIRLTKYF